MVLAFVGVGVNTFYPQPAETSQKEMQEISREIEALNVKTSNRSLTATEQAAMTKLQDQQNALQDKTDAAMKTWARNTSIILVLFATLVMVISLLLNEQLRVISNGLLLGGLFTMLYGVGWVIFSGNSTARFVVILFALVVALGLGYLKFVRQRREAVTEAAGVPGATTLDDAQVAGLAARVSALGGQGGRGRRRSRRRRRAASVAPQWRGVRVRDRRLRWRASCAVVRTGFPGEKRSRS